MRKLFILFMFSIVSAACPQDPVLSDAGVVADAAAVADAAVSADVAALDAASAADASGRDTQADPADAAGTDSFVGDAAGGDGGIFFDAASGTDRSGDPCQGLPLCAAPDWYCEGDIAVSCWTDENDCLVESREDCSLAVGGYCSEAGVLAGCRDDDPCGDMGTCPAAQYCDADVLRTCLSGNDGCADVRGEQDCTNDGKICDDSTGTAQCVLANPSACSDQIQALRSAIDAATSLPVIGDWDINNALVTSVKAPLGADSGGFFIQCERHGPAIFVPHTDPVGIVAVGDEVSIWTEAGDLQQGRRLVSGLGWLDILSHDNDVTAWVQDLSSVDIPANLDSYDFELIRLDAVVSGPFQSAGSGFVDATLTSAAVSGSIDLRLRIPTALATQLLGSRSDLVACQIAIGPSPLWRYFDRAQATAMQADDLVLSCE